MFRLVQPAPVWCDLGKDFTYDRRYYNGVEVCVVACNGLAPRKNSSIVCCHLSGLGQSPAYMPGLSQKQLIFQCFKCKLPLFVAIMSMWNGCHYEIAKYCAKRGKEEKHDKTANFYARPLPPMPLLLHGKHLGILIKGFAFVMFSQRSPMKEWIQDLPSSACTSRNV